ncbi:hypothetical protein ANAEL_01289 [Anaerolineales bacterium]|nr:hypothetical protein ANAEL_01289 [Anaerolineales bacterium]
MNSIFAKLSQLDFLTWLWLFVIAFALHEMEEWNILRWYQRNYVDLPPSTDKAVRVWIVFVILVGVVWCAVATLPGNPIFAAYVFLPAIAVAMQNALQHVYWLFQFRQCAPGILTAVFGLIPLGVYLALRAVWQNYVSIWYVMILVLLLVPGLVQTVQAGNRMTKQIRAIHHLGIKLAGLLERRV